MTVAGARTVELDTLDLGGRLGHGGQGTVHEVTNKRINESGDAWSVVYKQYNATMLPQADTGALGALVSLLDSLDATQGRWLCEKAAWPAAVVAEGGQARGFLMRAVPDRFRFDMPGLTAKSAAKQRLATVEFLLNDDAYVAGIGLKVSDRERVLLLADLADILSRLHRLGIAIGDLSPKNLLFTLDTRPECFLIDCDAMRLRGASVLPQAETPDWQIPDGEEKATRESDMYKFGLLAIRLFARDQSATDPSALDVLGSRVRDLARACLDADPIQRPTPVAWADALSAAAATASSTVPVVSPPARKPKPPITVPKPRTPKPGTPNPASKPASKPQTTSAKRSAVPGTDGYAAVGVIVGIVLVAAYNWMPWISAADGSSLRFHAADAVTLSLFSKGFWAVVVGVLCVGTDEYLGNLCGTVLGLVSFGCLIAGYERFGNEYGMNAIHPAAGLVFSVIAAAVVVVICTAKAYVRYLAQKTP